jgi:tetratricopeptide (TPR) repeat protein
MTNAGNRGQARSYIGLGCWLCGWLLAAGFVTWHAVAVDRYMDRVTDTRFAGEVMETPLQRVPQAFAADGQMWVRHAIGLAERGQWRLRSTQIDNAPEGRAVYWNSAWALWLEACGRMRSKLTGESLPVAIANASAWANLPLFLIVMTLASGWVGRRWGGAAGALLALGLAGHRGFYSGFYPAYADHHGLINACVLGVVLGVVMAGAGWWRRDSADDKSLLPQNESEVMQAVTVSAVCGATGMWVSASSLVVTIALIGVAVLVCGLRRVDALCIPAAWQRWGRVGGGLSLGFYLLENFPDRLGLRLEVNNPQYALAWWAAGEAMAAVLTWRKESRSASWLVKRLGVWSAVLVAAPVVLWIKGASVFLPLDPFVGRIHESIHEFNPVWVEVKRAGWGAYADQVWILAGLLVLAGFGFMRKRSPGQGMLLSLSGILAFAALALGMFQNRWLLTASASVVLLGVLLTVTLRWRVWAVLVAGVVLFGAGPWTLAKERLHVERVRDVQLGETVQLLYRDIAGALRKAGADERSIILSDPNASVALGYYGGLRTLGTLYWENRDGLLAAAELLDATDDATVAARVHVRGITHIALVSSYDFQDEYHYALHGGNRSGEKAMAGLGHRLLYEHKVPVWLRPLNYRVPAELTSLGFKVALFAVDFETPVAIAQERIGRYQLSKGARDQAELSFMAAMTADPALAEPWLRLGELALAEGRVSEAYNFIRAGIDRAPVAERRRLAAAAASLFERTEAFEQAEALRASPKQ